MMRVVLVCPRFHPSTGGVETHVREVARRLPDLGVEPLVLTTDPTGDLATEDELDGVPVRRVRAWPTGRDWMAAPGLPAAIRRAAPDVIHVHSFQTLVAPTAVATAALARVPYLLTFHRGGSRTGPGAALPRAQLLILAPLLRRAAGLLAVSRFEAEGMAHALGVARNRIAVIPNGAELPPPTPGVVSDRNLLLSIGRLEPYKGHAVAIGALARLAASGGGERLRILGAGPDEGRLRGLAEAAGVGDRVEIGSVPGTERRAYADELVRAGCVLVLSRYESQGIAAWEAASLRRPLVVTNATALAELVAAGAAVGVPVDADGTAIAAAIRRARDETPAAITVPTWDACAAALAARYRAAAGGGSAA
jgi:glycosyltransferase involved in cell wall biosynthesis